MFQGRVVVITGAGSGIGRALALGLASKGAKLALADINPATLAETMTLLGTATEARSYPLDVSSREAMLRFADEVQRDFQAVHLVFNNAGLSVLATVEHLTFDELERIINVNLWGTIHGTKAFLPVMLRQHDGCIVNISSVFGLLAPPCQSAYAISKFGVRALTETLWNELEGTGVRAVLVHPGGINTNISVNSPIAINESERERDFNKSTLRMMTTTPDECARQIIDGLMRGRKRLLVGDGARTLYLLSRFFPDNYGKVLKRMLRL